MLHETNETLGKMAWVKFGFALRKVCAYRVARVLQKEGLYKAALGLS